MERLERAIQRSEPLLAAFNETRYQQGKAEGMGLLYNALYEGLPRKAQEDLTLAHGRLNERFGRGQVNRSDYQAELAKLLVRAVGDQAVSANQKDTDKIALTNAEVTIRAKQRLEQGGPVPAPKGGGGTTGGSEDLTTYSGIARAVGKGQITEEEGRRRWNEKNSQ